MGRPKGSRNKVQTPPCDVDGCGRPHEARGMCQMHYARWRKHGDPSKVLPGRRPPGPPCSVDGCGRAHYGRGLCYMHLKRLKRLGTVHLPQRIRTPSPHGEGRRSAAA